jgi:bifunctional DNA-binding transcriptional regulator/antitoxin component of YhaV-PrlF toxin-antitoxin module
MEEVTTIVKMDDQGRIRVPGPAREALGLKDAGALLEIVIKKVSEQGNGKTVPAVA